jgi:glycosyltransferase involved in cell wall biosynthesis
MRAVAILAVLPDYRASFIEQLESMAKDEGIDLFIAAGESQLDSSVTSDNFSNVYSLRNVPLLGRRLLWQKGAYRLSLNADVAVIDLNPRSLSAWIVLIHRKVSGKRVLVWGHVNPRRGESSATAPIRRALRKLSSGVISYTWSDAAQVRAEGISNVWVAANGLYPAKDLGWNPSTHRFRVLYVGRLVTSKKPELLLRGFVEALPHLPQDTVLTIVGEGAERGRLEDLTRQLGVSERVEFFGHVNDLLNLQKIYEQALISVSPGYVGLSLTQSLGFGVPMVVADREPHAPEKELLTPVTGSYFAANDPMDLARAIIEASSSDNWDHENIVRTVSTTYSSTAMAHGFMCALLGVPQKRS